jgi:hypothetical protein
MNSFMVSLNDTVHPTDESLLALIHEQPVDDAAAIRGHITMCATCRTRFSELSADDATIASLLGSLDHPVRVGRPSFGAANAGRLRRAMLVAGAAATMAAAAAAMVPGSPVRRWIEQREAPPAAATRTTPAPVAPSAAAPIDAPLASGIAVPPTATMIVTFRHEQRGGVLEVRHTSGGDVYFRSRGGVTAYDVAEGQVSIDNQSAAETYMIDFPASVRKLQVRIGERTLLRWPEDSAKFASPADPQRARVALDPENTRGT